MLSFYQNIYLFFDTLVCKFRKENPILQLNTFFFMPIFSFGQARVTFSLFYKPDMNAVLFLCRIFALKIKFLIYL